MRKIRPAAIRQAEKDHENAKAQLRNHRRMCGQCDRACRLQQYAQTCEIGWAHLRYERVTAAQLRAAETDQEQAAPLQLALF